MLQDGVAAVVDADPHAILFGDLPSPDDAVNDSEEAKEKTTEKKAWSADDVQSLFIKAINFRSPVKDLETVLRCGAEVNKAINNGLQPLHYAAYTDNVDCVELLLQHGANVNGTDDIGYTPLHLSARRGNYGAMEKLLENGAIVNFNERGAIIHNTGQKTKLGYTSTEPLNLAVQNSHPKCAELLLKKGARSDNKYFMGHEICLAPLDGVECLEMLMKYGADPNVFNRCGLSPLMKACKDHYIDAVRALVKHGANVNAQCPALFEQRTVLHFAINSGNIVIINILLGHGAKVEKPENYKYSALHSAVMKGRFNTCQVILQYGGNVNERTEEGATPLMLACSASKLQERKEIVTLLIDAGAEVNVFAPYYNYFDPYLSPLVEYLKNVGYAEGFDIVALLIKNGAKVHFSSNELDEERRRDPFSVIPYCKCLAVDFDMFQLLLTAATKFDPLSIHATGCIPEGMKDIALWTGTRPRDLKHLARFTIHGTLGTDIPEKVPTLPIPQLLKTYLCYK